MVGDHLMPTVLRSVTVPTPDGTQRSRDVYLQTPDV